MSSVEVKEQVRLSLGKCVELVLSGIKYRLFRAAITVVIIALAVAFLMNMLSETLVAHSVASAIAHQTAPRDKMLTWVKRLSKPMTPVDLSKELASANAGDSQWQEFAAWGGLNQEQLARLSDVAGRQHTYLAYFEQLPEGDRRRMVGSARGVEILRRLTQRDMYDMFVREHLTAESKIKDLQHFATFLSDWQETEPLRQGIIDGHARARQAIRLPGDVTEVLASADESLLGRLAEQGFRLDRADLPAVRDQASLTADASWLAGLLRIPLVKRRLADRRFTQLKDVDVNVLFKEVDSSSGANWLSALMEHKDFKSAAASQGIVMRDMAPQRMQQAASDWLKKQNLAAVEQALGTVTTGGGLFGFSDRTGWLIVVSFMVCVVGIANAMLMSVTERFREIATMKCLGATDGFIMINFILESIMQGVAGGVIGAFLGLLLGAARSWAGYGWIAISQFPLAHVLLAGAASLVVGVLISATAAVYPAWAAARLAPMEAMRIE